ncbi:MAG: hypothetical protein OXG13_01640 [Gemmatimonadaceae bacterium]|nr:hypothetical protein [Gemmatimonadaceae bacterium]
MTVDYARRRVTLAGRRVPLTDTEYRLLVEIAIDLGTLVTYEDLQQEVMSRWVFNDRLDTRVVRNELGDSAGVFGAAMLGAPAGDRSVQAGGENRMGSPRFT